MSQTTGCPTVTGGINNGGVELGGSLTTPGSAGGPSRGGRDDVTKGTGEPSVAAPCDRCADLRDGYHISPPESPSANGPVTLRDLIGFAPRAGIARMEPNGWMVIGLPVNFYVEAPVQVLDGQLLSRPASVRFTSKRYHWVYGDGHSATLTARGAPWAAQGVEEFEPTPTSHVYRRAGTYSIDLTIDFTAEYRFAGGDWTSIAGSLAVPANRLVAIADDAKTVLVARDCATKPSGPGC
ncbi:MAG TPA: hypothetical protein VGC18_14925 [Lacisediminihabitans sp.]|uniref:hypothetical protein n=1 Tax=Lacisediminihabitans sp. TaxID=2787631 RepID=UPI002ED958AA